MSETQEKETTAKGPLLVNRGKAVFHIRPSVTLDKEGKPVEKKQAEPRDIAPGEAFHADDEAQAEALLNYHAISDASEVDPRLQSEIDHHKAEIERLEAEMAEQKKPVEDIKAKADAEAKKETAAERESRKQHQRR